MEGILAFGGVGMLFMGLIALILGLGNGLLHWLLDKNNSDIDQEIFERFFKIALLIGAFGLLVGAGMCTLQSVYYPIHWQ